MNSKKNSCCGNYMRKYGIFDKQSTFCLFNDANTISAPVNEFTVIYFESTVKLGDKELFGHPKIIP